MVDVYHNTYLYTRPLPAGEGVKYEFQLLGNKMSNIYIELYVP